MAIFNNYYFHDLTQKYILIFGSLFSDMKVQKIGSDKKSTSMVTVPINYAAKEKYAQRMEDDPEQKRQTAISNEIEYFFIHSIAKMPQY
jgi:hypothetical protein